jgi:hypothetical protein
MLRFVQNVRNQLHELFWDDLPPYPASDDRDPLRRRAFRAAAGLARQKAIVRELSRRLAGLQEQKRALAARVQIYHQVGDHRNAWRYALELDRVRKALEQERKSLRRAEQLCHFERTRLQVLLDQLAGA